MFASSRLSLASLARGEVITRQARRRAGGLLDLALARGMKAQPLLPGGRAWESVREPVLVPSLAALRDDGPPTLLRPRQAGGRVHVVPVARVVDVVYRAGAQELLGLVEDPGGAILTLRVPYRTVAPGAIDAVHEALERGVHAVSGELRRTPTGWETRPLALSGDRHVVPDLEPPPARPRAGAAREVIVGGAADVPKELAALRHELGELAAVGVVKGATVARGRARDLARRLAEAGLSLAADVVRRSADGDATAVIDAALVAALMDEA
jgi:hypothetical protein